MKKPIQEILLKIQKLCSHREYCKNDIFQLLTKWKIDADVIDSVIKELQKDKYIDELRYAIAFANDKMKFNKWGKLKIRHALQGKKIPEDCIYKAIENIVHHEYLSIAKNEIMKKFKKLRSGTSLENRAKLFRFAYGKGFEPDVVQEILDEI